MKKAAIIGMGVIAPVHIAAIRKNPEVTLAGVCDIEESRRSAAPENVPFYTDYKAMIHDVQPDVVHICLPHYLHLPVSKDAAELGVHVFCEKPLALNAEEGREFVRLEDSHPGLHMGLCLQNRFNDSTEMLKRLIDSGEYGAVRGIRGTVCWHRTREYYEASPWRGTWDTAGGGCIINQAIHTLDLLYYLGGEIQSLKAVTAQLMDFGVEVEDTAAASLRYADGAQGLFLSTVANSRDESVQISVQLEKGSFLIMDSALYRILQDGSRETLCRDGAMPGEKFYYGSSHDKAIGQFYEALEKNSQDYLHVRDGLMSIRLTDAIQKSSRSGKEVIL
ncbi:MAG: Gfo/Idh/MocA family oxidoreductase [Lachnospiraceae bacterium]|uniref:Gfo/Idh/MocA family protein n=1 Tax=uncultured Acetatifactor sp. TaxID=1671927 RepID=UPI0026360572|nr:Gfo/Idh/MocA family oxidoreductase [uncultured Acetatifactor sp.]MCI8788336.1 Gfo/Idh/MocA family oxidoreductase [Lachnospiraceae bacterium]